MSEQLPQPSQPEARVPSDEQLREGFFLEPDETVAFEVNPNRMHATRSYDIGNGVKVNGRAVAELRFGGTETFATGTVINTFDAPDRRHDVLVVYSPSDKRAFSAELVKGQMWGIGRGFEGQDMLPDTVSGDHCAVGLDENNRLVIENHNPTNFTSARRIG